MTYDSDPYISTIAEKAAKMSEAPMGLNVRLTRRDMSNVVKAARGRQQLARSSGVIDQRRAGNSSMDIEQLGLMAEIAVAKVLGCDYSPFELGVDDGSDMWLGNSSIDVKASFHASGSLLFKTRQAFRADCAIFVTATSEDSTVTIVGGCSKARFMREAENVDLGRGPCWIMQQQNLSPIEAVWKILTEERFK